MCQNAILQVRIVWYGRDILDYIDSKMNALDSQPYLEDIFLYYTLFHFLAELADYLDIINFLYTFINVIHI